MKSENILKLKKHNVVISYPVVKLFFHFHSSIMTYLTTQGSRRTESEGIC